MKKSKVVLGKKIVINKVSIMPLNGMDSIVGGEDTIHQCAPSTACTMPGGGCNEQNYTATCPIGCVSPVYTVNTCSFSKL